MNETFSTVAVYQYLSEAQIAKGRLEAEGIQVFMTDHFTVNIDPLMSQALGGIKLKVFQKDEAEAKEILESIANYSQDDQGQKIHCPNCDSTKIDYFTTIRNFKALLAFIGSLLFAGVLPIYTKYEYRCENCKHRFNIKD